MCVGERCCGPLKKEVETPLLFYCKTSNRTTPLLVLLAARLLLFEAWWYNFLL